MGMPGTAEIFGMVVSTPFFVGTRSRLHMIALGLALLDVTMALSTPCFEACDVSWAALGTPVQSPIRSSTTHR
jgi:hypothetical protein